MALTLSFGSTCSCAAGKDSFYSRNSFQSTLNIRDMRKYLAAISRIAILLAEKPITFRASSNVCGRNSEWMSSHPVTNLMRFRVNWIL